MHRALLVFVITVAACGRGGIAGAGLDSDRMVQEARAYPSFVSPALVESVEPTCNKDLVQQFENMFSEFSFSLPAIESTPVHIEALDATVTYRNNVFALKANDKSIVSERLPAAFYMHPVRLGMDELSRHRVIVIANKSRATTGLYFVAVYDAGGRAYYKKVLSTAQVWDIGVENEQIEIRGRCEIRRIRFAEPNKPLQPIARENARAG